MTVDRRTVVTGGTTLALTAATQAQTQVRAATSAPVRLASLNPLTQTALDKSAWILRKRSLASKYNWLKPFAQDLPTDTIVFNTTSALISTQPPYDAYQIETLASAVSALLDRCLTYRQNLYSLDEKATMRALDYELFQNQIDAQRSIELAASIEQRLANEKTGQSNAANAFVKDTGQSSGASKGFYELAKMATTSASIGVAGETARQKSVNVKWDALADYQRTLQARHDTPGNALNYTERFQRVSKLLEQDVGVAYQKLRCLSNACNALFGLSYPLSAPTETGYLDYMVLYTRELLNKVEIATTHEVTFNHVAYLRQPKSTASDASTSSAPLVANWDDTLASTRLFIFNLKDGEFPAAVTRLRMQSLGLSIALGDPATPSSLANLKSASAIVFPPVAPDLFSGAGGFIKRPPLVFEGIGITEPGGPRMQTPTSIRNIDPRGEWRVQVSTNFYQPSDLTKSAGPKGNILDIKLHLTLTGLLSPDSDDWKNLSF